MEHGPFTGDLPSKTGIFHDYVGHYQRDPEGGPSHIFTAQAPDCAAPHGRGLTPSARAPGRNTPAAAGPRPVGAWRLSRFWRRNMGRRWKRFTV